MRRVARPCRWRPIGQRDFIARIGGEEFVWLLPETDAESAGMVARKCLHLIRQQQIRHDLSAVSPAAELHSLFIEPNPAPVKTALALEGLIDDELRAPMLRSSEAQRRCV